jgi:hypothetical protein
MDQGLICMNLDPSTAPPIVVAYPDGPDIGPSSAATSNTLNLGTNLNNPLGLITFFPQEDTVDPMKTDEEQTATTAPLGDDPTAFNSTKATWLLKLLCRHNIAISSVEEAVAESRRYKYRLCIEPPLHALAAATHPMMIVMYQATTAALPWGKPTASETAATTMVAPTSSATMIALTGVTALSCHITAAGCGTNSIRCSTVSPATPLSAPPTTPLGSWGCTNPRKGGNIFIELLQHGGAYDTFSFIGGTFIERVGIYVITSWPDTTNIVDALVDALHYFTPMVAITGQVHHRISGIDAFQEMSIAEVARSITKNNNLILDVDDIPCVIHQRKTSEDHRVDFFHIILGVIVTTELQEYVSLMLDHLDPDNKLFTYRLYHNACRYTRDNRLVEDSATTSRPRDHVVITNGNPTIYALQSGNVVLMASFVKTDNDQEPP